MAIYNRVFDKSLQEAEALRTKITEIKRRISLQKDVNAKFSERLQCDKDALEIVRKLVMQFKGQKPKDQTITERVGKM